MNQGSLALVLHAHLPFVKSKNIGSLEEDWFYQALMECYLPLLKALYISSKKKEENPKITIGLSPTLLSLLNDRELKERFPKWINTRLRILKSNKSKGEEAVRNLESNLLNQLDYWREIKGDLITKFRELQTTEIIDLITCAATHGYLPLLRENPEVINGQLKTAVKEHARLLGVKPLGIWLPECAYYEGLDEFIYNAGLKYAILDGHGLLHANPRPKYGIYAPICSRKGIAFFGRDSEATLPVWSAKEGYPGDACYREFHRDLGWDLNTKDLNQFGISEPRPLGLKLHRVTSQTTPLKEKKYYKPKVATKKAEEHAKKYLHERSKQLDLIFKTMQSKPILVAPFDAELFGHWWFEGPNFLSQIFSQANKAGVPLTTLKDILKNQTHVQLCEPSPSSWGQGGYHDYWMNESNSWLILEWSKAGRAMAEKSRLTWKSKIDNRVINQAARELLLAQSSDWSFILRAGTTTMIAKEKIELHLERFWILIKHLNREDSLKGNTLDIFEKESPIFPIIDYKDWS